MAKPVSKERIYTEIKKKLINCEYKPGSWINETALSRELGTSRTPVREALTRIEHEGFIHIMPKRGIYVTEISLNDVKQIFQTRKEIEPITVRLAGCHLPGEKLQEFHERFTNEAPPIRDAMWLDTAMHLFIVEHSGNRFLIDMMRRVFEENLRIIISSRQNEAEIHYARAEHAEILEMLMAGQIDAAALSMFDHLCHCEQAALEFFYNSSALSAIPVMYHASIEQIYRQ